MATRIVQINDHIRAKVVVEEYELIHAKPEDQLHVLVKELIVKREDLEI